MAIFENIRKIIPLYQTIPSFINVINGVRDTSGNYYNTPNSVSGSLPLMSFITKPMLF